jgi:uracil-DNA glycosylase
MTKKDIRQKIWKYWENGKENCNGCPAHDPKHQPRYGGNDRISIEEFQVMVVLSDPNIERGNDNYHVPDEWEYMYSADRSWENEYMNQIIEQVDGHDDFDDIYFTNAHKCPPYADDGLSEGLEKDLESLKKCQNYLSDEIAAVSPNVVVALSNHSIGAVGNSMPNDHEFDGLEYKSKYSGATEYVEEWIQNGKRFYGTDPAVVAGIHPSYWWLNTPSEMGDYTGELAKSINAALDSSHS